MPVPLVPLFVLTVKIKVIINMNTHRAPERYKGTGAGDSKYLPYVRISCFKTYLYYVIIINTSSYEAVWCNVLPRPGLLLLVEIPNLALGDREKLKSVRLQIADRSVDRCQDRMLGWVSIFALWDTCSGCQFHCSGKLHLIIRILSVLNPTSTNPTLLHVKPVNAAASRASSSRLNLFLTGKTFVQIWRLV